MFVLRNTKQKGNREEDVAQDCLQSQFRVVDVQVVTPPGKETIDKADNGNNAKKRCHNGATNLDAKPRAISERMQEVLSLVFIVIRDHNTTGGESLLRLRVAQLGDG